MLLLHLKSVVGWLKKLLLSLLIMTRLFLITSMQRRVSSFRCSTNDQKTLRYGENPHQKGYFYGNLDAMFDQIHGKEISYNNLLDINAAVELIDEVRRADVCHPET